MSNTQYASKSSVSESPEQILARLKDIKSKSDELVEAMGKVTESMRNDLVLAKGKVDYTIGQIAVNLSEAKRMVKEFETTIVADVLKKAFGPKEEKR